MSITRFVRIGVGLGPYGPITRYCRLASLVKKIELGKFLFVSDSQAKVTSSILDPAVLLTAEKV